MKNIKEFYKHTYLCIPKKDFEGIIRKTFNKGTYIEYNLTHPNEWLLYYKLRPNITNEKKTVRLSKMLILIDKVIQRLTEYFEVKEISTIKYNNLTECFYIEYKE